MCNYLHLVKSFLTSSTIFNFWNVNSGEFPKIKSGTIEEN